MPTTVKRKCERCKCEMEVRVADVKRGWGRFCSKSCKAEQQEKRTHQFSNFLRRSDTVDDYDGSWDAHNY